MSPRDSEHRRPDRIQEVRKDLYSRNPQRQSRPRNILSDDEDPEVARNWKEMPKNTNKKDSKAANYFFWGTLIFLVLAAGLVYLSIETGLNVISSENVELEFVAPNAVASGDVVDIEVRVKNRNDVAIKAPALLFEFPEGTRDPESPLEVVRRERIELEDINPGSTLSGTTSVRLYGSPKEIKDIHVVLEYGVPDSAATFNVESTTGIRVESAPFVMRINAPETVATGEVVELEMVLTSNSDEEMKNIVVVADYPSGFIYTSAAPAPSLDTNVWSISSMDKGARKTFKIVGRVAAQEGDERVIRINAGLPDPLNEKRVGIPLAQAEHTLSIEKSVLPVTLLVDGARREEHSIEAGDDIDIELVIENASDKELRDITARVELKGDLFVTETVEVIDGQYRAADNILVWTAGTHSALRSISPGGAVRVRARLEVRDGGEIQDLSAGPELEILARVQAESDDGDVVSEVQNVATLVPEPDMNMEVLYDDGPFDNEGPYPAVEDEKTTYTVKLEIVSPAGDLGGARVTAQLPSYVEWLDEISPERESAYVTFSSVGRLMEWDAGDVASGRRKTIYIQLAATPTSRPAVAILQDINLVAEDLFSGTKVEEDFAPLSIEVVRD